MADTPFPDDKGFLVQVRVRYEKDGQAKVVDIHSSLNDPDQTREPIDVEMVAVHLVPKAAADLMWQLTQME